MSSCVVHSIYIYMSFLSSEPFKSWRNFLGWWNILKVRHSLSSVLSLKNTSISAWGVKNTFLHVPWTSSEMKLSHLDQVWPSSGRSLSRLNTCSKDMSSVISIILIQRWTSDDIFKVHLSLQTKRSINDKLMEHSFTHYRVQVQILRWLAMHDLKR